MVGGACVGIAIIVVAIHRRRGNIEQASANRELVGAMAVGQEAVVTNAMEAIRQYMEEEAAYELGDRDPHDLPLVTAAFSVVLPAEGDVGPPLHAMAREAAHVPGRFRAMVDRD